MFKSNCICFINSYDQNIGHETSLFNIVYFDENIWVARGNVRVGGLEGFGTVLYKNAQTMLSAQGDLTIWSVGSAVSY